MKGTFISMCVVLVVSVALCIVSMTVQFRAIDEMDDLRIIAIENLRAGDLDAASEKVVELAKVFEEKSKILELLASHNDLHDAYIHIVDAKISLESQIEDDVFQALVLLGESFSHLRKYEGFSLENIY